MEGRAAGAGPTNPYNSKTQQSSRPSAEISPTHPGSISQEPGKSAEGLPPYRTSCPCAPPAGHTPFSDEKRSALHEPTQHAAMPDAAHSVGHRTALHLLSQNSPAFAPPNFPVKNSAPLTTTRACPMRRKSPRATQETTPLHPLRPVPQPGIPNCQWPQSPFHNPKFLITNCHKGFFCAPFHALFYKKLYLCPTYTKTRAYGANALQRKPHAGERPNARQ